jgi:phosphoribosylformimino-5-aminoimidazole carboxamide ribotide isomerase
VTAFQPIPVLDLMGGQVVRARAGERESYRPLTGSAVAPSAVPLAVVESLLRLHPFRSIYMADLDAILGRGDHDATVATIAEAFPELDIWLDAGFGSLEACRGALDTTRLTVVVGSESQRDDQVMEELAREPRLVLSLDSQGDRRLGPQSLFRRPEIWPDRVIAMTLGHVGTGGGPDLEGLVGVVAEAGTRRVFAAGGVRDAADLEAVAAAGGAGALIASALHDGRIGAEDLRRWR